MTTPPNPAPQTPTLAAVLKDYAHRLAATIGESPAAGVRAMCDAPDKVARDVGCTPDEVVAWAEAQDVWGAV
jgi:hypothetical protein